MDRAPDHRRLALILLFLAYTLSFADRQVLAMLFEPIKNDLLLTDTELGFLGGFAFVVTYTLIGIPLAMLADRRSRKAIVAASIAFFSLMTALCGVAGSFIQIALARVGVGLGEAGVNPATNSILADYYPRGRRSFAMAVVAVGAPLGMMLGSVVGGVVSDSLGWRAAFFILAVPGLVLSLAMWGLLREPRRGLADGLREVAPETPSLWQTSVHIWRTPAMRYLYCGCAMAAMVGYGVSAWVPAFLVRSHGLSMTQVGILMAAVSGVMGISGTLTGGYLYDRIARRSHRQAIRTIAVLQVCAYPLLLVFLLSDHIVLVIVAFLYPAFAVGMYLGPDRALTQGLANVRMRAVATAINMLVVNLMGMGLGSQLVGLLSDAMSAAAGTDSLRYAMCLVGLSALLSAGFFWLCGHSVDADLETVTAVDREQSQAVSQAASEQV